MGVADHFGASMMLTLGALLADVPHSRPVQIIGTATDDDLIDRFELQRSRYEGPTGIVGVLQDACTQHGIPAASLWAAVPAYASQIPSPKAASALLSRAGEIIGTPAPLVALHNDVVRYEERVDEMVEDDEDLAEYVSRLDTMADEVDDDADSDDADDVSSIADEVERFLREQEN